MNEENEHKTQQKLNYKIQFAKVVSKFNYQLKT